ncbi:MAG TPA: choice-of-anchor tandem repeat GloVer-containing protein [Rhizomicrobium sp.]|nr:choice-of-anchor tandem repeat GloVer-containing protein [Rhizomicrobium sp.]
MESFASFTRSAGGTDGAHPKGADMLMSKPGNLYSTTVNGGGPGCNGDCGTVYEIAGNGTETTLHSFTGGRHDGYYPHNGLLQSGRSTFYGVAQDGGASNDGIVFRLKQNSFAGDDGARLERCAGAALTAYCPKWRYFTWWRRARAPTASASSTRSPYWSMPRP